MVYYYPIILQFAIELFISQQTLHVTSIKRNSKINFSFNILVNYKEQTGSIKNIYIYLNQGKKIQYDVIFILSILLNKIEYHN